MSGHGYTLYTRGCRCDVCKKAKADYMRARRAAGTALAQRFTQSPDGVRGNRANAFAPGAERHLASIARHGTVYGYTEAGCRCRACTTAVSNDSSRWGKRVTP